MSQPPPYAPGTFFVAYQAQQAWFPGQQLDVEFNAIDTSITAIEHNLAVIQGDDLSLANGSVGWKQISSTLQKQLVAQGFTPPIISKTITVDVQAFGADPTGVASSNAAFQAAITSLPAGGIVEFSGSFLFTGTVVVPSNIWLRGAGAGSTTITGMGTNLVLFQVGNGSNNPKYVTISGTSFTYKIAQTSGAAVWVQNGHDVTLADIVTHAGGGFSPYTSVIFDGGAQQFIYKLIDFEFSGGTYGIVIGLNSEVQDLTISEGVIASMTTAGISVQNVSGYVGAGVDIIMCGVGMEMIPGNGQQVTGTILTAYEVDTSATRGLSIVPTGTGLVYATQFIALWACSTTTAAPTTGMGIYINGAGAKDISFTGGEVFNNKQSGVQVDSGSYISFSNCRVSTNSQAGSASYPGYKFAASASNITVNGGLAGGPTVTVFVNLQSYGVVNAGASVQFTGVDLTGNVTGPHNNSGTGFSTIGCLGATNSLRIPATDGTPWLFAFGATKGIRAFTTSSAAIIEGVDNLGTSFTPLQFGGLALVFTASGSSVGDYNATAANTWTFGKRLVTAASVTGAAGVNLPSGTGPTSPVDGDMWYDGTNLKFRVGASTKTVTLT